MRTSIPHALALTLALAFGFVTTACDKKEDKKSDEKKKDEKSDVNEDEKKSDEKAAGEDDKEGEGGW